MNVAISRLVTGALAVAASSGCGLVSNRGDTYVVQADSIGVGPVRSADNTVPVRVYGFVGGSSCQSLKTVERSATGDTLFRRFIGVQSGGGNCFLTLSLLEFEERLPNVPARRVVFVVRQARGAPLARTINLPLP